MQNIMLAIIMLVINENHMAGQVKFSQPYGSEKDYKQLWYLNIQYIQCWVHSDTATFDKLLWAEDFVHQSGANGYLFPKKEIMPIFGEKRFGDIEYFYADNTRIQFITDNVAMVLSRPPYFGKNSTKESLSQYNDVYVKRNGNWICVSANITAITGLYTALPILKMIPAATKFVTVIMGKNDEIVALTRLHQQTKDMFEKADYKKVEELLDSQFILLTKDGSLFSKKELLDGFKTENKKKLQSYTIENLFMRFVTADVAMMHGVMIYKFPGGGMSGVRFNDIYVKRGHSWKCVSSNNTTVKN